MIEQEWLKSTDTIKMVEFLRRKTPISKRKFRLCACACAKLIVSKIRHPGPLIIEFGEGSIHSTNELEKDPYYPISPSRFAILWCYVETDITRSWPLNDDDSSLDRVALYHEIVRDIFGNPFRNAPLEASIRAWNDGTILKLAQTIYAEGRFKEMPILADALEEAGCIDRSMVDHCRQPIEHVHGCWVLDLLLDKP